MTKSRIAANLGWGWLVAFAAAVPARADVAGPDWVAGAYFVAVQPSAYGGELSLAAQFQPVPEHELLIGPKAGVLTAFGDGVTRFDANFGIAETLWVVNAVGGGVDLDVVAPSTITGEDSSVHYRVTPTLAVRLLHFGQSGAWSARVGVPYDTHYHWGFQAGVTLQFNGLAPIGSGG
jgi:hypothetical protein